MTGLKFSNFYISQGRRKCGIEAGENYNLYCEPFCGMFICLCSVVFGISNLVSNENRRSLFIGNIVVGRI